jgi:hypothetical protein
MVGAWDILSPEHAHGVERYGSVCKNHLLGTCMNAIPFASCSFLPPTPRRLESSIEASHLRLKSRPIDTTQSCSGIQVEEYDPL